MGSIRVRQGRYQANVRRKGYATVTKTFTSKEVAKRWIKTTEIAIEKGEYSPKISTTVGEMLDKYKLVCLAIHNRRGCIRAIPHQATQELLWCDTTVRSYSSPPCKIP